VDVYVSTFTLGQPLFAKTREILPQSQSCHIPIQVFGKTYLLLFHNDLWLIKNQEGG